MSLPGHSALAVRSDDAAFPVEVCQCHSRRAALPAGQNVSRLAHLYLCEGLSTYRIAQLTHLDRQRVTRRLRRAGVPLRPRGAGGTPPR